MSVNLSIDRQDLYLSTSVRVACSSLPDPALIGSLFFGVEREEKYATGGGGGADNDRAAALDARALFSGAMWSSR